MKIFLSHSSKYADLAKTFKLYLEALASKAHPLDISISEEMAGATDWREWIKEHVRTAEVFVLLYPHESMEMGWPNYELGRFYDEKRPVICIRNDDIPKPPPAFEPYQSYKANKEDLTKFLKELFVQGQFSSRQPLNLNVDMIDSEFYRKAENVVEGLVRKFTDARVRNFLYERRIVISLEYSAQRFDPSKSLVSGNPEGMQLLRHHEDAFVPWSTLRTQLDKQFAWLADLESAIPSIANGSVHHSLSPFHEGSEIYIPVVSRASSVDKVLQSIVVIFVPAGVEKLRDLIDWSTPSMMPDNLTALIRIMRMMARARWTILEPAFQEVKYREHQADERASTVKGVVETFRRMSQEAKDKGTGGLDKFYGAFDRQFWPELDDASKEYVAALDALQSWKPDSCEGLPMLLARLLDNNTRWLNIAAKQFLFSIEGLRRRLENS